MTGKIIMGAILSVTGAVSSFLGVLFLIASGGQGSRLLAGIVLLAIGITILLVGIIIFRKAMSISPAGIKKKLLKLARLNNGEISEEEILASLGNSDIVEQQLNEIMQRGIASEVIKNGRKIYIFPDFQLEIVVKECPYCGNDYPLRDDIEECPSCGGDLKMHKSLIVGANNSYSMDD
ncbi:hypothetical protein ACFL20_02160 [Spirochaetota bacterium]